MTDGGPPFNGNDSHALQQYFKWAGIKHHPTTSAEDPEANGLAEAFMKNIKKIWHTSTITKKDPMAEINKLLSRYRATPHPSTGKTPAELMYGGRRYRTRLPDTAPYQPSEAVTEARQRDRLTKSKQKRYKDRRQYVRPHKLAIGDKALLSQKQSKINPPYDPNPYVIVAVRGHQITGKRGGKQITRDAQKWKRLALATNAPCAGQQSNKSRQQSNSDSDIDIDIDLSESKGVPAGQARGEGVQYPTRGQAGDEDRTAAGHEETNHLPDEEANQEIRHDAAVMPRRNPPRAREKPARYR